MPTINSVIKQTEMLGQLTRNNFRSDIEAANDSILVGKTVQTNANFLKSDFGGQPALTEMIENYTAERDNFQNDFRNALDSLQKSSDELKTAVQSEDTETDEEVATSDGGEKNISVSREPAREISVQSKEPPKIERDNIQKFAQNYLQKDDEPKESESIGEEQASELSAVQNLVRDYNNAVDYLDERSLSRNSNLTESLGTIGISVSDSGELAVDEETLLDALKNNYSKVGDLVNNLAGQLDKEMSRASQQSENLFPTIEDYADKKETDRAESYLYSARNPKTANYTGMRNNQFFAMNV